MLNRQSLSSRKSAIPEIFANVILKDESMKETYIIRPREKQKQNGHIVYKCSMK